MESQNQEVSTAHPSVILSTKDINNSYNTLKEKGVCVEDIQEMSYGKMFTFKDQDGNRYLLREDN